jgi:hypothetical protein
MPPLLQHPAVAWSVVSYASTRGLAEVRLSRWVREVQVAVTAAGQPRLLIRKESTVYNGGSDYLYAACNQNCTDSKQWAVSHVLSSWGTDIFDISDDKNPQRSFALDLQGRPRFFYLDRNYFYKEPDHYGSCYAYCDADCNDTKNRCETEVGRFINYDAEVFKYPSLAFTKAGQPRVVARIREER